MNEPVVRVTGLGKSYGPVRAVDQVSFTAGGGEVFGLLGPNGAGKTTTLEIVEGLRAADEGAVSVLGLNPVRERRRMAALMGVQLQSASLPGTIRVSEAMRLFCAYHGRPPRHDLLDRLGLSDRIGREYGRLSTGEQRRLALALAVAHDPRIVILDEPTAGLDVASRSILHELVRELRDNGKTVILSTHDMAEAEALADRVAILLQGRLVVTAPPRELTAGGGGLTKISVRTERGCLHSAAAFPAVNRTGQEGDYHVYFTRDVGPSVSAIIAHTAACGDVLIDLRVERPSLEERFLEITGGVEA